MTWNKLGCIFVPEEAGADWLASHATMPRPLALADRFRVFFAGRGRDGKGRIGYVDLDRKDPTRVIGVAPAPVLDLGEPGMFDDSGLAPSSVLQVGGKVYLYYQGWNGTAALPGKTAVGLAESTDDGASFTRRYRGPVLERNHLEPYFVIAPTVLKTDQGWTMWYSPITGMVDIDGRREATFHMYVARSENGVDWQRTGSAPLPPSHPTEVSCCAQFARAGSRWRVWFSVRGATSFRGGANSYRIGYAESTDGSRWERNDALSGIDVSPAGWDSEMVCYGGIAEADAKLHMFYNGNGFGKTGFGYAVQPA